MHMNHDVLRLLENVEAYRVAQDERLLTRALTWLGVAQMRVPDEELALEVWSMAARRVEMGMERE